MQSNHFSRHAQQVLTVARGRDPAGDPSIARSWLRCLEDYHLDPAQTIAPTVLEHGRLLESRERRSGGVTAHPYGLYLVQVEYHDEFPLPERFIGPHFLTGFSELDG